MARSLARARKEALIADVFSDADTRIWATECLTLPVDAHFSIRETAAVDLLESRAPASRYPGLVYGSDLEAHPDFLERIARGRRLYGNPPEVLRRVKNPKILFPLMQELAIPFPEVRFCPPVDFHHWLMKPAAGSGGRGVRWAEAGGPRPGAYFQRYQPGTVMSALFLSDGRHTKVLGWNSLWSYAHEKEPFLFGGAINRAAVPAALRRRIEARIQSLAVALELRGLMSLDFVFDRDEAFVLEINPRPPASFELHEGAESLILWHMRACDGELPQGKIRQAQTRAFRILYARDPLTAAPAAKAWPHWCRDLPVEGGRIEAGAPLCSVHSQGSNAAATKELLDARVRRLEEALYSGRRDVRNILEWS